MDQALLISKINHTGYLTLNRPKALNSLSLELLHALHDTLSAWRDDESIKAVMIEGSGDRAFCAGGDIRQLYHHKDKVLKGEAPFFDIEYAINQIIFNFPKPYVAIMDGITMGGGIGVSIYGSHPIATDRLMFAMPETGIGFFPDIGASHFLNKLPDHIGTYLGLTGIIINADDAYRLGLVKTVIAHDEIKQFKQTLDLNDIQLPAAKLENNHAEFFNHLDELKRCFCLETIEEIFTALSHGNDWCQQTLTLLKTRSPLSLKVTLEYLQRSRGFDFAANMQMNHTLAYNFLKCGEFFEGIRAAVIDKDKSPKWQYTLEEIDVALIDSFFI